MAAKSFKREPQAFHEAFRKVLLHRTGVVVTAGPYSQELMDRELDKAQRQDGHAGEQMAQAEPPQGPDEEQAATWSENSDEFIQLVQKLGPRNTNLASENFVKPFFRHLRLAQLAIRVLDDDSTKFTRLTYLDVSRNALTEIDNLPPNLKFLKAYNNPVSQVTCRATPSLCFLGLGHSSIGNEGLEQTARRFRNLLSLDMSYSDVAGVQETASHLQSLQHLRHLCLAGSPVCVLPHYRLKTLAWLKDLQVLDGVAKTDEEMAAAQQLLTTDAALAGPPEFLRIAIQPHRLTGARALLTAIATAALDARRAAADAAAKASADAAAAAAAEQEQGVENGPAAAAAVEAAAAAEAAKFEEPADAIVEACDGGALRFQLELPDGTGAQTAAMPLKFEPPDPKAPPPEEGAPGTFDSFEGLRKLKSASEEPLFFNVAIGSGKGTEDDLLRFCRWLRTGLTIKVLFCPRDPSSMDQEAAVVDPKGKAPSPVEGEPAEPSEPPKTPPAPVFAGGTVVALDTFFWWQQRNGPMVPDGSKLGEQAPLKYDITDMRVLPAENWLEPELQVPLADQKTRKSDGASSGTLAPASASAKLDLSVTLHAGEAPGDNELEEETKAPEPKGKAKAKGKK